MEQCIFCKIAKGEIPSVKIWENEEFLSFLDINPNTEGMSLVITKDHFDSDAFLIPESIYRDLMSSAKKVVEILKKGLNVNRVSLIMEGMGVNHVHIKLYPMHGLRKEFQEIWAKEKVFFNSYPGYITTQLGPKADIDNLKKIAKKLNVSN